MLLILRLTSVMCEITCNLTKCKTQAVMVNEKNIGDN